MDESALTILSFQFPVTRTGTGSAILDSAFLLSPLDSGPSTAF